MDGNMTPESFIGATKVRTKTGSDGSITAETYFQLGPVALAVQNGDVLILDEIDRAQPEYLTALQAILEDTSAPLVLNDDGVREDLSRLNHKLFAETLVHAIEVDSAETMTALFYAYGFHIVIPEGRHFNTNTEEAFSSRIQPIIDLHFFPYATAVYNDVSRPNSGI